MMRRMHCCLMFALGLLLTALLSGCDDGESGITPGADVGPDVASDSGGLDVPTPSDIQDEEPPQDLQEEEPPQDLQEEEPPPMDIPSEDMIQDVQDEDLQGDTTLVVGRVWNYYVTFPPLTATYDYPWDEVIVSAYGTGGTLVGTAVTDADTCEPWDPPVPYTCGMYELELDIDQEVMLKATDNYGYKDTLTQIFTVEPGVVRIIVMVGETIVTLLTEVWGVEVDDSMGHLVGIVAVTSSDVHAAPYEEYIGNASIEITPSDDFGEDFAFVYYDSTNPLNTDRTSTDAENPVFAAINLPPRSIDDPYEMTITHSTYEFEPIQFAVQEDVLTFVVVSPEP